MTRHQRRKAAKAIREAKARNEIVSSNLSNPQAKRPVSRLAADYARQAGFKLSAVHSGGLHRNNQVPIKHRTVALQTTPEREAIVRLRVMPTFRDDMRLVIRKEK